MYPLTFAQVASILGLESNNQSLISKVIIDSRQAKPGSLFFALPGTHVDGHQYVPDVLAKGGFAVVKTEYGSGEGILPVSDPLLALQQLAAEYLKQHPVPVIAVTGSNGKTTTKDLIAQVLSKKFVVHKTKGNFNNELGLPLTILELEPEHEIMVLEMGMRGLGEIAALAELAPPDVAVITNVGPVHLELLGSLENVAQAKTELLEKLSPEGLAILNGDDSLLRLHSYKAPLVWFFGEQADNQLQASNINIDQNGLASFTCHWQEQKVFVKLSVPGKHNVLNSLAAIAVGLHFGISLADCAAGLKDANLTEMRLEVIEGPRGVKIINDAYNASPASMAAALDTVKSMASEGRKVAILGDMFELGSVAEQAHQELGRLASQACDYLIYVGSYAALVKKGAEDEGLSPADIHIYSQVSDLIQNLEKLIADQDLVLVKASRGMALEQVVDALLER
ncbi:MAG: UDP-N-acetylmuramoyl-tripeptide--D-alanyl-D-alanine ligase [Firmicutes bacterium]|nr:UDP-N-acetylmuramoyl-tripeptide--D-alanyl-D-alanine ligase [Bacillota bacterium]